MLTDLFDVLILFSFCLSFTLITFFVQLNPVLKLVSRLFLKLAVFVKVGFLSFLLTYKTVVFDIL